MGYKFNGVSYQSHLPKGSSPEQHLQDLLDRLRPFADNISTLAKTLLTEEAGERAVRIWLILLDWSDDILPVDIAHENLEFTARLQAGFALDIDGAGDSKDALTP